MTNHIVLVMKCCCDTLFVSLTASITDGLVYQILNSVKLKVNTVSIQLQCIGVCLKGTVVVT